VTDLRQRLDGNGAGGERVAPPVAASPPAAAASPPATAASSPATAASSPATAAPRPQAHAAAQPPAAGELRSELGRLLAARDFAGLMKRAQAAQAAIAADPALGRLLADAQELMEAAPYVDRFLEQARAALAAGRTADARVALDKAKALDSAHPALPALLAQAGAVGQGSDGLLSEATRPGLLPPHGPAPAIDLSATIPGGTALPLGEGLPLDLPPLDLADLGDGGLESFADLSVEGLDEPVAAAPAPSVAPGAPSDPDPRVAELLDEGQALYGRGELQAAIDAWSRIFLIDIDHQEAARRIDLARNAKAEQERQLEEVYHEALAKAQSGAVEEAKADLQRVLQQHPNHLAARETLDKLERGEVADVPAPGADPLLGSSAAIDEGMLHEEILVPPEPGEVAKRPSAPPIVVREGSRRTLMLAAAAILVVLAAAGWFLRSRWSSLFPNTDETAPVTAQAPQQSPITRATQLAAEGKRSMAIAQLKRVPPPSPYYEEAQALIAQWEAEETAGQAPSGPPPELLAQRDALLAQARSAGEQRRYLAVGPLLDQAAAIAPLSPEDEALRVEARDKLQPLESALRLVRNDESQQALRDLWLKLNADPGNADVRQLLTTAYYNMGVGSLQAGRAADAVAHLGEAADLAPDDREVQRARQLAETYANRDQDLLFRIYVKYLNPRKV
jgi:tetratricopeptide (TPR) repeat protein